MATRRRVIRVPKRDQPIYDVLSRAFRDGVIYAFSYDGVVWTTFDTWHDWDGAIRNGRKRCYCVGPCEFGPRDWSSDELREFLGLATPRRRLAQAA